MEKRVILAFVLSFAVLYAFRSFYAPPAPPQTAAPEASSPAPPANPVEPVAQPAEKPPENIAPSPSEAVRAESASDFSIEMPLYTARFTNAGGVLKSFRLTRYSDGEGYPLELINSEVGQKVGWPLALVTGDKGIDDQLKNALFVHKQEGDKLTLEFAANGVHAVKTLQFNQESHEFTLETRLSKDGKEIPHSVVWQGSFGDQSLTRDQKGQPVPEDLTKKNAVYQVDAAFTHVNLGSLKEQPENVTTRRAGVEDQYFLAMFLSADNPFAAKVGKQDYTGSDGKPVSSLVVSAAMPQGTPVRLYVGPKQQDWLSKADPQLATVIDWGYFEFIAKPLVFFLLTIYSFIGNFGWAIIILTVIVNLVLFPLKLKQQVSMLKMQKIQPHMKRLQDQYKKLKANDPKRAQVQSEMMGLYKEHGVNPMGGCLPLLLQMPFFLGFYSALFYSIELRRAPWIFWIKDLSQHDPYWVIPILMAVAMIVQQKLTPTPNVDPVQARMMLIMPVMMTFLFLYYPSGLSLYWLTGSVVGVGQQIFMNKYWSPKAEAKLSASPKRNEPRGA